MTSESVLKSLQKTTWFKDVQIKFLESVLLNWESQFEMHAAEDGVHKQNLNNLHNLHEKCTLCKGYLQQTRQWRESSRRRWWIIHSEFVQITHSEFDGEVWYHGITDVLSLASCDHQSTRLHYDGLGDREECQQNALWSYRTRGQFFKLPVRLIALLGSGLNATAQQRPSILGVTLGQFKELFGRWFSAHRVAGHRTEQATLEIVNGTERGSEIWQSVNWFGHHDSDYDHSRPTLTNKRSESWNLVQR